MICAFHAYQFCKDSKQAELCADVIWAEADSVRQHLVEIGEQVLPTIARLREQAATPARPTTKKEQSLKV